MTHQARIAVTAIAVAVSLTADPASAEPSENASEPPDGPFARFVPACFAAAKAPLEGI